MVRCNQVDARTAAQIAHAKAHAPYFAALFKNIDPREVASRAGLAKLPVTRKSALLALQKERPPFGGLAATPPSQLARVFMSPGPIYDPEGKRADYWRLARPLFAPQVEQLFGSERH